MGSRYCAINSPLGSRWGQKSLDLRSRDFCPHLEPRGELIAQYRPPMSFRYNNGQDNGQLVEFGHWPCQCCTHHNDVIMSTMMSQIISLTIVYSSVYSGADQRKHQSTASLAFVRRIHWWPMNSPHKGPVARKMFPFDDDIMTYQ